MDQTVGYKIYWDVNLRRRKLFSDTQFTKEEEMIKLTLFYLNIQENAPYFA